MRIKSTIALLTFITNVFAQAPTIQWQRSAGGSSDDFANSIQQTTDGGSIVAGYSSSIDGDVTGNHGAQDYWVVKFDAAGTIQWQQSYGGANNDVATSIRQTTDSGYIVAGYSESADGDVTGHHGGTDTSDCWVVKLNASGTIQWQKSLGGTDYEAASSILQTSDSGYIVAGFTQSSDGDLTANSGGSDYWVVKLTSTGTIQWQKSYGGSSYDNAISIQQTTDQGYIVAGTSYSNDGEITFNHGSIDYWVVKLTSTGSIQWEKSYGGTNSDDPTFIVQTEDNGYIISGYTYSIDGDVTLNYAVPEYWIVKTDTAGAIQWQKTYGGQSSEEAYAVQQTADGGYIVAGRSASTDGEVTGNHGVWDCWLLKLDNTGAVQWKQCYGGPSDDGASMIYQTADGGYILAGHAGVNGGNVTGNHGAHDYWIVKLNAVVGIDEISDISSITIFPNPAANEITICTNVILAGTPFSITDQTGKEVLSGRITNEITTLAIGKLTPGIYIFSSGGVVKQFVK